MQKSLPICSFHWWVKTVKSPMHCNNSVFPLSSHSENPKTSSFACNEATLLGVALWALQAPVKEVKERRNLEPAVLMMFHFFVHLGSEHFQNIFHDIYRCQVKSQINVEMLNFVFSPSVWSKKADSRLLD